MCVVRRVHGLMGAAYEMEKADRITRTWYGPLILAGVGTKSYRFYGTTNVGPSRGAIGTTIIAAMAHERARQFPVLPA